MLRLGIRTLRSRDKAGGCRRVPKIGTHPLPALSGLHPDSGCWGAGLLLMSTSAVVPGVQRARAPLCLGHPASPAELPAACETVIPAAAAAAFIKGRGTPRFSHLHSSPPPPRVPFLCAPPPASLACLLSLSPLFPLPADTLAVEGRQLGLGVAAFCPHIPEPTNLGLSLWPDTPGPAMPSAGRQEVTRVCLGLHSFSPESFLLPCPQGPGGTFTMTVHFFMGPSPPGPLGAAARHTLSP